MAECSVLFVSFGYVKKALGAEDDSLSTKVPTWKVWLSGRSSHPTRMGIRQGLHAVVCALAMETNPQAPFHTAEFHGHLHRRSMVPWPHNCKEEQPVACFLSAPPPGLA